MKKVMCLLLSVLMVAGALSLSAFAASDAVAFMNFATGNDSNSGTSADAPKKSFGTASGSGVVSLLTNGGTLVVTGKAYIGLANFEFPAMPEELVVTSNYGGVDYKIPHPRPTPTVPSKCSPAQR